MRENVKDAAANPTYATPVGLVYVFNLIVGTGALALPKAFQDAGYVLGSVTLAVSCFLSYISATFVIESMCAANAVVVSRRMRDLKHMAVQASHGDESTASDEEEQRPLIRSSSTLSLPIAAKEQFFEINERVEMSEMAAIFLGKFGLVFFYVCLAVYLFGDLAIYAAVVPKSLMNAVCDSNQTCIYNASIQANVPCFGGGPVFLTRFVMYRILTVVFGLFIGPFVFFGMTRTKYIQLLTTLARWTAFVLMISLAVRRLLHEGAVGRPPAANARGFGSLFGVAVYAFMCHHSLPGMVTPMKSRKGKIYALFSLVFGLILVFYLILSLTGVFAFGSVQDVYTLNFLTSCHERARGGGVKSWPLLLVDYFLVLFPVFALSSNFPIVGITLRNNLAALLSHAARPARRHSDSLRRSLSAPDVRRRADEPDEGARDRAAAALRGDGRARRLLLPLAVLVPPFAVALLTDDVEMLASVTGSYAGVGVQYVLPAMLVLGARRRLPGWLGQYVPTRSSTPFRNNFWPLFMYAWALLTVILVSVNLLVSRL